MSTARVGKWSVVALTRQVSMPRTILQIEYEKPENCPSGERWPAHVAETYAESVETASNQLNIVAKMASEHSYKASFSYPG